MGQRTEACDAREIAEAISEGINSVSTTGPAEVVKATGLLLNALAALIESKTVWTSFRPTTSDVERVQRLHDLAIAWRDTAVAPPELTRLVEQCLAMVGFDAESAR